MPVQVTTGRTQFSGLLLATITLVLLTGVAIAQESEINPNSAASDSLTVKSAMIDDAPWRTRSQNAQTTRMLFPVDPELELSNPVRELATVVAAKDNIRLVTILGRNDVVNLSDLLFLQGVDSAVVRADAVEFVKRQNEFPGITRVVNTLARLHEQKLVILARADIDSIEQLDGKKVASGIKGSSEHVTASLVLEMLEVNVTQIDIPTDQAISQLIEGQINALFYLRSPRSSDDNQEASARQKANDPLAKIVDTDQIIALPLTVNDELSSVYTQAELTSTDLPGLIDNEQTIAAVAVQVILAGYRWNPRHPRYAMAARFTTALIDSKDELQNGNTADYWAELDFKFDVPGIQPLNTVRSLYAQREAEELQARQAKQALAQAQFEIQKRLLDEKQAEINLMISERLGDADLATLQELKNELEVMMDVLDDGTFADQTNTSQ